jgi:hypothetical protein
MALRPQSFENHARIVPLYHGVLFPVLALNFGWAAYRVFTSPSGDTAAAFLLAIALVILALYARGFALSVQDRVIRLEMRLRLQTVLPADLRPRIGDFTLDQLVALRFASDEELPALAATVLRDGVEDRKAIKKMVRNWQADHLRV